MAKLKGTDIITTANLHNGRSIDDVYAMRFINEAIATLATMYDSACVKSVAIIAAMGKEWVSLPDSCYGVLEVTKEGLPVNEFEIISEQVRFKNDGTYELLYLREPSPLAVLTNAPEIDGAYHYAIALFVASREKSRMFGDQESDSGRLMTEFRNAAHEANIRILGKKKTVRNVPAPTFR